MVTGDRDFGLPSEFADDVRDLVDQIPEGKVATYGDVAELVGNRATGVAHLFDYLDGYRHGRIAAHAEPVVRHAARAVIDVDAGSGSDAASASSIGPAGDGGAAPISGRSSSTGISGASVMT